MWFRKIQGGSLIRQKKSVNAIIIGHCTSRFLIQSLKTWEINRIKLKKKKQNDIPCWTKCNSKEHLSIVDAKTTATLQAANFDQIIDKNSFLVTHKNTLHIIGGKDSYKHCTADINGNNIHITHTFNFKNSHNYRSGFGVNTRLSGLVYLESSQQIYGFGAETDYDIWRCNLCTNEWMKLNIRLPMEMWNVAVVSSLDEKYILFFGGLMSWHAGEDYIERD
eukprot:261492_1